MRQVCTTGTPATCGDSQVGSTNVTANGLGICRVGDFAGGLISPLPILNKVTVNGLPIIGAGHPIVPHGLPPHTVSFTVPNPTTTVFIV